MGTGSEDTARLHTFPMTRIYAAADIGSNTAHLLVAACDGELVMRIDNLNEWVALGEVVARQGAIPKDLIQDLVLAVRKFKRVAAAKSAECLYVFATEAMRAATNHDAVLKKIEADTGVRVEIISPSREAALSMRGITLDTRNYGVDLMFEVGGGSAQVGKVERNLLVKSESLPIGTGRIIAESGLRTPSPDYALAAAQRYIDEALMKLEFVGPSKMGVASGGVARGLWRAVHPDGEKVLILEELDYVVWSTSRLPMDRIVARFGVKQRRAGTLLPGALVYRALMRRFDLKEMVVSEFGIREGAVLEMFEGKIESCRA